MINDPKYCPRCGTALTNKLIGERTRPVCPSCDFIFYLNPIVAAGTLVEHDGRVALVQRGVEPGRGRWGLPTGYAELGETAEEAAIRETWEEIQLRVEVDGLLDALSYNTTESQGVLLIYAAHVVSGELKAGDDAIDAAWFAPDELPEIAFRTHHQILHRWRQARAIVYRPATLAETEFVTMLSQVHAFECSCDYATCVTAPDRELFVAIDNGNIVGFATIVLIEHNQTAQIEGPFVRPRYRRWGIGTGLIETCLNFSREKKVRVVSVAVTLNDLGWTVYVKKGFRVSGFTNAYYQTRTGQPETALFLVFELI
ncbi:MAG: GNAT family N-acetyltransferase [Anaerolineae bacterium]|nr:GNAT family N-acetyltransferase [Anaerolineae bacterium]